MESPNLTIYYLATGTYSIFWEDFFKSLPYFLPSVNKHVILLSDSLSEYDKVESGNITVEWHHIDHYTWPIIALNKYRWILEYPTESEYIYYFNANTILKPYNNMAFVKGEYVYVGKPFYPSWNQLNQFNPEYIYIGTWFFGGNKKKLIPVMKWCNDIILNRLANNIIDVRHDETVMNEYVGKYGIDDFRFFDAHEFMQYTDKNNYPEFRDKHPYYG